MVFWRELGVNYMKFSKIAPRHMRQATRSSTTVAAHHDEHHDPYHGVPEYRWKIGNREVVGPSFTGREEYFDLKMFPCPPIRFRRPSPEIDALRKKEQGDWKLLTVDEKKQLYRYSFCQTFAEFEAPTPQWKFVAGNTMYLLCVPILMYIVMKSYLVPPLPETLSDEGKKKVVRFYIDNQVDPIEGIASKWDYEKQEWKKKPYMLMKKKTE